MGIKLYYIARSFRCRVVAMTLEALNLEYEVQVVNLSKGEQRNPEYLAINPVGKVPCLKDGDFVISESRAISTYLCNHYEKGDDSSRLYPVDSKARGIVDQMLHISENLVQTIVLQYMNLRGVAFFKEKPNPDKLPELHKALQLYEHFLSKNEYIAGNQLTVADFFMHAPLDALEISDFDDYKNYPKTVAWRNKLKKLPYFDKCNKEGSKDLRDLYKKGLEAHQS